MNMRYDKQFLIERTTQREEKIQMIRSIRDIHKIIDEIIQEAMDTETCELPNNTLERLITLRDDIYPYMNKVEP